MTEDYCVVLMTAPDAAAAEKIAGELVRARLAACVTRLPGAVSTYHWQGKVETAQEVVLLAKSRVSLASELVEFVRKLHPNSVPEIVALPIAAGHAGYLDWIGANTRFSKPKRAQAARGE
ncbi:MAG TPA: divalent-cation tolerance protein CutA [Elusimicrobiota bacterium]|jgi:periplasmic divalent cation tolerance protein|nr:divalent-cation tolerance protein CutA [Elusimicrobiota bacterium]